MTAVIHSHHGKVHILPKKSSQLPRNLFFLSATQELHVIFLSGCVFSLASGFAHFSNLYVVFVLLMLFKSQGTRLGSLQGWQTGISDGMVKLLKPQGPNPIFLEANLAVYLTGAGDHTVTSDLWLQIVNASWFCYRREMIRSHLCSNLLSLFRTCCYRFLDIIQLKNNIQNLCTVLMFFLTYLQNYCRLA